MFRSAPGEGIWIVKSRQKNFTSNQIPAAIIVENAESLISTTPSSLSLSPSQAPFISSLHSYLKKLPQKNMLTGETSVAQALGCGKCFFLNKIILIIKVIIIRMYG